MKYSRFLLFTAFLAFATGCNEEIIAPQTDGEESETPVDVGDPADEDSGG